MTTSQHRNEQHLDAAALDAAALDAMLPGAGLASVLAQFAAMPQSEEMQLAIAAAWTRMVSWSEAGLAAAVVDVMGAEPQEHGVQVDGRTLVLVDLRRHELAAELRLTPGQVRNRVHAARTLVRDLAPVHAALEQGAISAQQARAFVESADRMALGLDLACDADLLPHQLRVAALCDAVLPRALRSDVSTTRQTLRRAVAKIDHDGAERRRRGARKHTTGVWIEHDDDGVSTITACLPTPQANACFDLIRAVAKNAETSVTAHEPVGMRRAQAFCDLILTATSADRRGQVNAPRVHLDLVMDLTTLLGFNDDDAELRGVGPVSAAQARELLADDPNASMRRLIVDPLTRELLDVAPRRYAIGARLRRFLEIRDQRCRFLGCTKRADTSEIDHAQPFGDGGASVVSNLGALCKEHHQAKTHRGWTIASSSSTGACDWIAPSGRVFKHVGEPVLAAPSLVSCSHLGEPGVAAPSVEVFPHSVEPALATPSDAVFSHCGEPVSPMPSDDQPRRALQTATCRCVPALLPPSHRMSRRPRSLVEAHLDQVGAIPAF